MTSPLQQKIKISGPVVITANRVADGAVVYRTTDESWTAELARARVATTAPDAAELLAGAIADGVVATGAYVAPVRVGTDGTIEPGNLREQIRARGPTIDLPITAGA
jgi:hypothetical protein